MTIMTISDDNENNNKDVNGNAMNENISNDDKNNDHDIHDNR